MSYYQGYQGQPGQQPMQPGQPGQPMMAFNAPVLPQVVVGMPMMTILRYPPHEEPSLDVPYELKPYYSEEVWAARIPAITRKASRYYKKGLEWVWLILSFSALLGVPIAVYYVALHNLPDDPDEKKDDDDHHEFFHFHGFDKVWKARLISLAAWIAVMIVVFVPMKIWKAKGKQEVNEMLQKWEQEDRAVRPEGAPFPTLKMKQPGVISKNIKISVTIPPGPVPSMYQMGAQLPPYLVNGPSDPEAANFYQPPQGAQPPNMAQWGPPSAGYGAQPAQGQQGYQPGYPQQGAVPLYGPRDEQVPGYTGFTAAQGNEKNPFEDVKV